MGIGHPLLQESQRVRKLIEPLPDDPRRRGADVVVRASQQPAQEFRLDDIEADVHPQDFQPPPGDSRGGVVHALRPGPQRRHDLVLLPRRGLPAPAGPAWPAAARSLRGT